MENNDASVDASANDTVDASADGVAVKPGNNAGAIAEDLFCPECTYNLRGAVGDRCPECSMPLDTRIDDPVAAYKSRVGLVCVVVSLLLLPVVGFPSLFFVGLAQYKYLQHHSLTSTYRASYATRKRQRLVKLLCVAWIGEALILILISRYWSTVFPLVVALW